MHMEAFKRCVVGIRSLVLLVLFRMFVSNPNLNA
jgi:hypothetical protein